MTASVYRSTQKRDSFRAIYNRFLSSMPFAKRTIATPYGETFLLEAGDAKNPAVLLLHGSCSNSAFWYNDILALMASYHVFAVDIPGEAGNSSENRLRLDNEDYALWLFALLNAIRLETISLAGNSLGGWMALKFATAYPTRVEKLMLFASGGLADVNKHYLQKAADAEKSREDLTFDADSTGGAAIPKEILDFLSLILASYEPILVPLPVFSCEALRRLTMPVLYVAGEADNLLDTQAGKSALQASVPHAEIYLLPNAGHTITNPSAWMLPFLSRG